MKYSKHNIFSKIRGSDNYFIVNLLNGNADILNDAEAGIIEKIRSEEVLPSDQAFLDEITEKGYLIDPSEEESLFRQKYLDFIDSREKDEIQLFLVLNYTCNFAC